MRFLQRQRATDNRLDVTNEYLQVPFLIRKGHSSCQIFRLGTSRQCTVWCQGKGVCFLSTGKEELGLKTSAARFDWLLWFTYTLVNPGLGLSLYTFQLALGQPLSLAQV